MDEILLPPMQASGEFDAIPEPEPDRKVIVGVCVMDKKVCAGAVCLCWKHERSMGAPEGDACACPEPIVDKAESEPGSFYYHDRKRRHNMSNEFYARLVVELGRAGVRGRVTLANEVAALAESSIHACVPLPVEWLGILRSNVLSLFLLSSQASSSPMTAIMDRMKAFGEFEVG